MDEVLSISLYALEPHRYHISPWSVNLLKINRALVLYAIGIYPAILLPLSCGVVDRTVFLILLLLTTFLLLFLLLGTEKLFQSFLLTKLKAAGGTDVEDVV